MICHLQWRTGGGINICFIPGADPASKVGGSISVKFGIVKSDYGFTTVGEMKYTS